ncbi:hypothetical protein FACS1894152_6390 [Bacilli bacterium]|nr:hypothetical protein FACS1894152_6390 [Bacilli bacterium]
MEKDNDTDKKRDEVSSHASNNFDDEELEEFLTFVIKEADYRGRDELKNRLPPLMKELFFKNDNEYSSKTIEQRYEVLINEISNITGIGLYSKENSDGKREQKDILLFSQIDSHKTLDKFSDTTISFKEEENFNLFWRIVQSLGDEMFMQNRRELVKDGKEYEPKHPTSKSVEAYKLEQLNKLASNFASRDFSLSINSPKKKLDYRQLKILRDKINSAPEKYKLSSIKDNEIPGMLALFDKINNTEQSKLEYTDLENAMNFIKKLSPNYIEDKHGVTSDDSMENIIANFTKTFMDSTKKLIVEEVEKTEKVVEGEIKNNGRKILVGEYSESTIIRSIDGFEHYSVANGNFFAEKNRALIEKIFSLRDKLPIGSYFKQVIEEGGTNLTCDNIFSGMFAALAKNAVISTDIAIPTGNIMGKSELPVVLEKISNDPVEKERFIKNNPVLPFTNKSNGKSVGEADVIYVTAEYLTHKWREAEEKAKAENKSLTKGDKEYFISNLFDELKSRVDTYYDNKQRLEKLEGRVGKLVHTILTITATLEDEQEEHLKNLYKDKTEEEIGKILDKNKIALALQKLSVAESKPRETIKQNSETSDEKLKNPQKWEATFKCVNVTTEKGSKLPMGTATISQVGESTVLDF